MQVNVRPESVVSKSIWYWLWHQPTVASHRAVELQHTICYPVVKVKWCWAIKLLPARLKLPCACELRSLQTLSAGAASCSMPFWNTRDAKPARDSPSPDPVPRSGPTPSMRFLSQPSQKPDYPQLAANDYALLMWKMKVFSTQTQLYSLQLLTLFLYDWRTCASWILAFCWFGVETLRDVCCHVSKLH